MTELYESVIIPLQDQVSEAPAVLRGVAQLELVVEVQTQDIARPNNNELMRYAVRVFPDEGPAPEINRLDAILAEMRAESDKHTEPSSHSRIFTNNPYRR